MIKDFSWDFYIFPRDTWESRNTLKEWEWNATCDREECKILLLLSSSPFWDSFSDKYYLLHTLQSGENDIVTWKAPRLQKKSNADKFVGKRLKCNLAPCPSIVIGSNYWWLLPLSGVDVWVVSSGEIYDDTSHHTDTGSTSTSYSSPTQSQSWHLDPGRGWGRPGEETRVIIFNLCHLKCLRHWSKIAESKIMCF